MDGALDKFIFIFSRWDEVRFFHSEPHYPTGVDLGETWKTVTSIVDISTTRTDLMPMVMERRCRYVRLPW